jgi:hypothetical protein
MHACTGTHTRTLTLVQAHSLIRLHTRTYSILTQCKHTSTQAVTHIHTHTHAHTHTHTPRTQAHKRTHPHTHTHRVQGQACQVQVEASITTQALTPISLTNEMATTVQKRFPRLLPCPAPPPPSLTTSTPASGALLPHLPPLQAPSPTPTCLPQSWNSSNSNIKSNCSSTHLLASWQPHHTAAPPPAKPSCSTTCPLPAGLPPWVD